MKEHRRGSIPEPPQPRHRHLQPQPEQNTQAPTIHRKSAPEEADSQTPRPKHLKFAQSIGVAHDNAQIIMKETGNIIGSAGRNWKLPYQKGVLVLSKERKMKPTKKKYRDSPEKRQRNRTGQRRTSRLHNDIDEAHKKRYRKK